jgi:pimeloyl-ACP methyl ester carboxylesterase
VRAEIDRPVVFCLHYLGGSAREWSRVTDLVPNARCIPLDLPGFGDASETSGYTVVEMAAYVERAIAAHAPHRWFVVGHSMGAKIATVIARRAEDGTGLSGLVGLVLVAGSPPSPEPMPEEQRQTMLAYFSGDVVAREADARTYVARNTSAPLDPEFGAIAVADVLRANRNAWRAWLEDGSREDWADRIGIAHTPTLLIAGADDANLGPSAQRALMAPHFANVRLMTLAGAKHLLPMERAQEVALAISDHVAEVAYRALIASDRVGAKTREALLARSNPDESAYVPSAIDVPSFETLRAVLARVIPQDADSHIDLAARIDTQLHCGTGDGWRFDVLPTDREAYRAALRTLDAVAHREHGQRFEHLDAAQQDDLLARVAEHRLESSSVGLGAQQMYSWFEELRADAVKAYLADLRTLAHIGYSGIANGGDGMAKSGFARVGLGEREAWEPIATSERPR